MARKKATKEASVMLVTPRDKFVPKKFYDRNAWSIQVQRVYRRKYQRPFFIIISNHPSEEKAQEILQKYIDIYKNYKIASKYVDTWGNVWKGKASFPNKKRMLNYIINKIREHGTIDNVQ